MSQIGRRRTFLGGFPLRGFVGALAVALSICLLSRPVVAVETRVLRDETFADFQQGESTGTEVLASGKLRLGPMPKRLLRTDDAIAWKVGLDRYDANMFVATGHDGRVWRVGADGSKELWADLDEVEVTAIAVDPTGGVLVGASPGGRIYRIVEPLKPRLFFETKEQHVWDLIFDRNDLLYAATGPHGKIFRIRAEQNGELYYDSDAANVMGLGFDRDGNLLAATQGQGRVLRISKPNTGYVLYAPNEDECRALTVDHQGNIYVAVNSARVSSLFERLGAERTTQTQAASGPNPTPRPASDVREIVAGMTGALASLSGKSFVAQIQPSGFVRNFWQAPESPIHALLADPGGNGIYVAVGNKGKIYRLFSDTNYSLVGDIEEQSVMSFTAHHGRVFFTTANRAALYALGNESTTTSQFASRPVNGGSTVAWGNLSVSSREPEGTSISVRIRVGNTANPFDNTWGEWIETRRLDEHMFQPTKTAVAQYLQYWITFQSYKKSALPEVDSIQMFCVQHNAPPIIKEVRVEKVSGEVAPRKTSPSTIGAPSSTAGGSTPSTPLGDDETAKSPAGATAILALLSGRDVAQPVVQGPPTGKLGAEQNSSRFNVSWDASDPNEDKLLYHISLKAEDEVEWRVIEKDFSANRLTLSTDNLADGRYRIKIEATDRMQNADDQAATATLVSNAFVVDNTPPVIQFTAVTPIDNNKWQVTATARDALSMISSAAFNVDSGKEWRALSPTDGIFDNRTEDFSFVVAPENKSTEHVVRLRITDREGNTKVEKILIQAK